MKTNVDACLKEIAAWFVQKHREMTELELNDIVRKHCESVEEIAKFVAFLGTDAGQLRFGTLLREAAQAKEATKVGFEQAAAEEWAKTDVILGLAGLFLETDEDQRRGEDFQ